MMQGNNVTYTGKSWRKKTYWEDLDQEIPESPKFLHRTARQYTSYYSPNPCYLPKDFHYYGMNKIKGGKGYREGHPIGIIGGPCPECEGTVVNLQMNTSSRGMECTSEKVCDTCGLIIDGAFSIYRHRFEPFYIREPKIYHTNPFDTHEEWLERMKELDEMQGKMDDVAVETELFQHWTGNRPGDDTEISTSGTQGFFEHGIGDSDETLARDLGLKTKNAVNYNRPSKEVMEYKLKQQMDYVDICKTQLGMHNGQVMDIKEIIIKHGTKEFHRRASNEDIIMCMCIHRMSKDIDGRRLSNITRYMDIGIDSPVYKHVAKALDKLQ